MARKDTTEIFISKARKVHGNKYDYSKVEYEGSTTRVKIICPIHGEYVQIPNNHLQGSECPHCCGTYDKRIKKFLVRIQNRYNGNIEIDDSSYFNHETPVRASCKKHKLCFTKTPRLLIAGVACPECGKEAAKEKSTKPLEEFIRQAREIHGDKYSYKFVEYVRTDRKVKIHCNTHNKIFMQKPNGHLYGNGCPECSFERTSVATRKYLETPASLYYIKITKDGQVYYKIGVTSNGVFTRFKRDLNNQNTKIEVLFKRYYEQGKNAYFKEQQILQEFRDYKIRHRVLKSGNKEIFEVDILGLPQEKSAIQLLLN